MKYAKGPLAEPVQSTQATHISSASYHAAHDSHDASQLEILQSHLCISFSSFQCVLHTVHCDPHSFK